MPPAFGETLRILEPAPHVLAFYDGRVPGVRLHSPAPNWLDDGAYEAGIASYAVWDDGEALVYDTHISLTHARVIRDTLAARGVRRFTVVLSHWHDDHVAGNEVFADCEIIANRLTAEILSEKRPALEAADPPIRPLIPPTRTFEGELQLTVGAIPVQLVQMDIHSCDGTVARLPGGLLLAGDTLEDPVTYVDEPDRLAIHLRDLDRMAAWDIRRILPNHGAEDIIASGGYAPSLITATQAYVRKLLTVRTDPEARAQDLLTFAAAGFASGALHHFAPYDAVHRMNVEAVMKTAEKD